MPGSGSDNGCGTVNSASIPVPWGYQAKGTVAGGFIPSGGFVEGGIDLTALGLEGCFSTFVAETRSSPSVDAQLKDFALGDFEACGSELTTTPSDNAGDPLTDGPDDGDVPDVSIGTGSVLVKDAADLVVTGTSTWEGTLDFYLCGPSATTCDANGTFISTHEVDGTTEQPILSDAATVTSVGTYCWAGIFTSGTEGVDDDSDTSPGECFEVLPVTPTISTNATATVEVGSPISDSATLGGTADQPGDPVINPTTAGDPAGGDITFTLYGPNDADCTGTGVLVATVPVSGDDTYLSGDYTPASAGTYHWVAAYSGDTPNTNSVTGACTDENETTVVTPKQPAITTEATNGSVGAPLGSAIDDTAHLTGTSADPDASDADGTITFTAYGPFAGPNICTGTAVYTSVIAVDGDGFYTASDGDGPDADTVPGELDDAFVPTAAGTYNWIAVYSGDLPNTLGVSGACSDLNESSLVISLQPTISTAQYVYPNDDATITVADGGGNLSGDVTFSLFDNDTCEGTALFVENVDLVGGALSETVGTTNGDGDATGDDADEKVSTDGTYSWLVEFDSGNTAHNDVSSVCHDEHFDITFENDDPLLPNPQQI